MSVYTQLHARSLKPLIRTLATKSAARALLVTLLIYFFAFQYCKYRLWRDPHSAFFNSDHVYDFVYSDYRKTEAESFVRAANHTVNAQSRFLAGDDPVVCAAYATVKRPELQYLTGSVGSMLHGLDAQEREALYLYLLFADTDPTRHPEWNAPWMSNIVDRAGTYNMSQREFDRIQQMEKDRNFYVKGMFDYVYILEECMNTTAPYIAIFEDDIMFADGWMARLVKALAQLKRETPSPDSFESEPKGSWLYLRLFHTETSLMWEAEDALYAYVPLVFALAMALTYFALFGMRLHLTTLRPHLDNGTIAVLTFITVPLFTALFYMMGKWTLLHPSGPTILNKHGCCTQALVFPRLQIPPMIEWMRMKKHGQTDSMIEEYADINGLDRYALFPQAVQHVGLQSSRDNLAINSQSTWAFYFETNEPGKLSQEHEQSVKLGLPWAELRALETV
jgi:hypothetical protein